MTLNDVAKLAEGKSGQVLLYQCPGCKETHGADVNGSRNSLTGASWTWNGSLTAPTLTPSVNVSPDGPRRCHHFVRDGRIEFCADSQHAMAGMTTDLLPFE